jgi:hypothetical protein
VIFLGLLNHNLIKAISYGDGDRETLTLKFCVPVFRMLGHTKYTFMLVKRMIMLESILSEADAFEYKHNSTTGNSRRFVKLSFQ